MSSCPLPAAPGAPARGGIATTSGSLRVDLRLRETSAAPQHVYQLARVPLTAADCLTTDGSGTSPSPYDVSEPEMRWQAMTICRLALGAKGVMYYCCECTSTARSLLDHPLSYEIVPWSCCSIDIASASPCADWTPNGLASQLGQAIMTPTPGSKPNLANQVPGPKYPMLQRINSRLRTLGEILLERPSSGFVQVRSQVGVQTRRPPKTVLESWR